MKTKDIAKEYGIDQDSFERYLRRTGAGKDGTFSFTLDDDIPGHVEKFKEFLAEEAEKKASKQRAEEEEKQRAEEEQENINNRVKNIILSTCGSVDGYRAVAQYGLVFGECLFKASFSSQLDAAFEDFNNAFSFKEKEMSGTTALLERARDYATQKMIYNAAKRGANAVVGIDAESSSGGNVMHITIYGTAVKLERIEDGVDGEE